MLLGKLIGQIIIQKRDQNMLRMFRFNPKLARLLSYKLKIYKNETKWKQKAWQGKHSKAVKPQELRQVLNLFDELQVTNIGYYGDIGLRFFFATQEEKKIHIPVSFFAATRLQLTIISHGRMISDFAFLQH